MSHTPGPWFAEGIGGIQMDGVRDGYMIHSETQRKIASLYGGVTAPREERWPNATLIAAAPDMLQVLKDIDAASWEINSKLGERIRGAIRQAEGETK